MKNLSFYIPLLILITAACNNENTIPPHSEPTMSIVNQVDLLEVHPLDTINLDVMASTTSDEPISSFTSYNDCVEKLSKDPDNVYQNQATYEYKAVSPYEKGETEIRFTAYTDKGETAEIVQKVKVVDEPFIIEIDSTDVPKSATDGSTFNISGTIKSKIPFNSISVSTSVIESSFTAVKNDVLTPLPHAPRTSYIVNNHTYNKDTNGYSIYNFDITFTVTSVDDKDIPQFKDKFEFSIIYNYYNANQEIKCSNSARFGNWTKTVNIE